MRSLVRQIGRAPDATVPRPPVHDEDTSGKLATVVARQAIYDTALEVNAYELLFRTTAASTVDLDQADAATAEVLLAAFTDIGLDDLVGPHRAFVNIPYHFLVDGYCATLPKERVVLEILEDVPPDARVLRAIRALADDGFTIALDDFAFRAGLEPLMELAAIIKVDVLALDEDRLAETVERARHYPARLLAEKVEHRDQIRPFIDMGFELFQGYALERPAVVHSARTSANRLVMLQVITELYKPDIEVNEIVEVVSRDPSLAYALLRIVNSASMSRGSRIQSIHQAVVLLGNDGLRNWATMIMMSRLSDAGPSTITGALVRAKMCERAARELSLNPPSAFTTGLLSALPAVLGEPLEEILKRLTLEPAIERALLAHDGPFGTILAWAMAFETADGARLVEMDAPQSLSTAYLESMAWAQNLQGALSDANGAHAHESA